MVRITADNRIMLKIRYLILLLIAVSFFIVGCSSIPQQKELKFNALAFDNMTGQILGNVSVTVKRTRAYVMCSTLHPGRSCSTGFQAKVYQGNPVYISWELDGSGYEVGPLFAQIPSFIDSNKNTTVVISFKSNSNITVELRY